MTNKNPKQGYPKFVSTKTKKLIEKSTECHSQPQPTPDTKRKRKRTKINACKINKQMHEKYIDQLSLFPKRGDRNAKRTEKRENKVQGKT